MTTPIAVEGYKNIFYIPPPPSIQPTLPIRPQLSAEEEQYVQELIAMPLDSILDNGSGEKKCKKLGQKIFDRAKNIHNGDTFKAKDVVMKICSAIYFDCKGKPGNFRSQNIERAWSGIGDKNWHLIV